MVEKQEVQVHLRKQTEDGRILMIAIAAGLADEFIGCGYEPYIPEVNEAEELSIDENYH